ncbi:3-methyladenine DNA glycosylase [Nocardioides sp. zg-536]|uniref:3-methyladenine DNA glycosylase n=1 Tax=Nocardioides faecalis TaxID=2803858 RepID=A0A939BVY9_9ACTN|nr:3-methyladenine DNA glycosylase [Nocardioides faecalis]QVI60485.1 3-methyladenine DNA glycosylase [Nocardioides faecalis]
MDLASCVVNAQEWRERAAAHAQRIDAYVAPHLARREAHVKHPVFDFLFTYYSHRPAQLRRWHPGFGVEVPAEHAADHLGAKAYEATAGGGASVAASYVMGQRPLLLALHRLLRATADRTPHFGCFGLHEWAMVYRLTEDQTRHADWPLRLGAAGTDEVVEGHKIACSHFDAYRFFTPPARPLNTLSPGRDDRADFEQPACLHAGMDLYKHAFRLSPMICSDLVAEAFELAWDIRTLDMRAAPYDLADLGFEPVRIETPEGKAEYVAAQRDFAERAAPLRSRLIAECEWLLAVTQ